MTDTGNVPIHCRSLLLLGPRRLAWVEELLPPPGLREVLVTTIAGAISIGTELPQYAGTVRPGYAPHYPKMTGYESLGIVRARGNAVRGLEVGDRVLGFYGHRTAAVIPARKAIGVPDGVSDALALLSILSCDVIRGVRKVRPSRDAPVLVTGAGTIGLLTLWTLAALGVRAIDVVEPLEARRALAAALGARRVLTPEEAAGVAAGYVIGFECSSRDAAFGLLQQRLGPGGRICVLADGNLEPLTLAPAFHLKELRVVASSDGTDYRQHAAWFFEVARRAPQALEALFAYHTTAGDLVATFERLASGEERPVKVFVRYPAWEAS